MYILTLLCSQGMSIVQISTVAYWPYFVCSACTRWFYLCWV